MARGSAAKLVLALALVAAAAWLARETLDRRVEVPGRAGWFTTDPDTLYHARRVERALDDGFSVAGTDPYLDAPNGAAIPWPPYATYLHAVLLAPFAPDDPIARHAWIERRVASSALYFGVAASLVALLAARRLAGDLAGLIAGLLLALSPIAVAYSGSGNGDHHALVSLLLALMLWVASSALDEKSLASRSASALRGAGLGALAGAALGTWVASAVYVALVELALACALFAHGRRDRPGLAPLGLAFHLAALAVSAPAIAASPWRERFPWTVVDLSWFHAAHLALGALVFAPLAFVRGGTRPARAFPWLVAAAIALLAGALAALDAPPWRGVREGVAWVSRADAFMAGIAESQPLVGELARSEALGVLGYGAVLLPLALVWLAWNAVRGDLRFAPWTLALAVLALQAALQARFAEALALPLSVALGVGAGALAASPRWGTSVAWLAPFAAVASQWPLVARAIERATAERGAVAWERPARVGVRLACEWIRAQPRRDERESVLALWSHGHAIEWAADRPSVATNFGSYVGEAGFRASARFFLEEDLDQADRLLAAHRARFVIADSELPNHLNPMIAIGAPERRGRYVDAGTERGGLVRPEWFLTMGARAMFDGEVFGPHAAGARAFDRLRLVWIAPTTDPARRLRSPDDVAPAAWVWERVAGAVLEARGDPGSTLEVEVRLLFGASARTVTWRDRASAGADGAARLRVPYATDAANGDGTALAPARFAFGARSGEIEIPERAVLEGALLALD
jgi:asparagine N-glycosylation enzyme membrane subunit Stt3